MKFEDHLSLYPIRVESAQEWIAPSDGWRFVGIESGQGYILNSELTPLNQGDMLIISPLGNPILRASQIGAMEIRYLIFYPGRVSELISPMEKQFIDVCESQQRFAVRHLPASNSIAKHFAALTASESHQTLMVRRSANLQVVAEAIGIASLHSELKITGAFSARERFSELLTKMSENVFIHSSLEELARQCRCSTRHMSRLFHQVIGISFTSRQTEVRMVKATHLLANARMKIAEVARDSGYRHVGLFNATFKKRWKMTPREWRSRHFPNERLNAAG